MLAGVEVKGGSVTVVARRHRISQSVLYSWRAAWRAAAAAFVPLGVLGGPGHRDNAVPAQPRAVQGGDAGVGGIDIALPNGARLNVDALVNEKALSRAMKGGDMIGLVPGTKVFSPASRSICGPGSTGLR